MLEALKEKYSKLYPQFNWVVKAHDKTNYSPCSQGLTFESDRLYSQRFVAIKTHPKGSAISNKFGQFELNIYLHPIVKCYGEDTADQNPTISKYFFEMPTQEDFNKLIGKQKSTYFPKL